MDEFNSHQWLFEFAWNFHSENIFLVRLVDRSNVVSLKSLCSIQEVSSRIQQLNLDYVEYFYLKISLLNQSSNVVSFSWSTRWNSISSSWTRFIVESNELHRWISFAIGKSCPSNLSTSATTIRTIEIDFDQSSNRFVGRSSEFVF